MRSQLVELEQPRAFRDEQPDRQLNRRDVIDEVQLRDRVEQVAVVLERQPRMKRDEGRHQRQPARAAQRDGLDEIARV